MRNPSTTAILAALIGVIGVVPAADSAGANTEPLANFEKTALAPKDAFAHRQAGVRPIEDYRSFALYRIDTPDRRAVAGHGDPARCRCAGVRGLPVRHSARRSARVGPVLRAGSGRGIADRAIRRSSQAVLAGCVDGARHQVGPIRRETTATSYGPTVLRKAPRHAAPRSIVAAVLGAAARFPQSRSIRRSCRCCRVERQHERRAAVERVRSLDAHAGVTGILRASRQPKTDAHVDPET